MLFRAKKPQDVIYIPGRINCVIRGTTRIETPRRISTHSTNNGVTRMSLPLIIVSTHQLRNVLLFTASARRSQSMTPLPVVKSLH